ncbi:MULTISPECIES: hypothetical protein [Pseudomonas]|uniref:hypothetical protein n=1 Tax=Pseudomonas TaxID=286 RepID=UPI001AE5EA7D|nr:MULTISPECIES: hypothetical protein [unclassified Pseudomonas]MBP2273722.1 hypothetical protein [Pseudomonas sp. BP6]MBP2287307.1 hypothetical protein [Pseudomonas sp. BP7]HDS1696297.1 hypothetical protein [Pseudomonas putida]HDS1703342.1 hypothetical protein [Pseudomonas putida]
MSKFLRITDHAGKETVVNANYVVALQFDRRDNGATLLVAQANSEGARGKMLLVEEEANRVETWLLSL